MTSSGNPENQSIQPRLFVDVTTSVMLAGQPPLGIGRVEGELAHRLLRSNNPRAVPVVFRGGEMFALPDDVLLKLWRPGMSGGATKVHFSSAAGPAPAADALRSAAPAPRRMLMLALTSRLRSVARVTLARLPERARGDARLAMIHARQAARVLVYGHRRPSVAAADDPTALEMSETVPLRHTVLPALRAVVHPQRGDMLFSAGLYSNFVPLRAVAELRRRTGLRVGCVCYDLIRVRHPEFNPPGMSVEAWSADMLAMLDGADLIWPISDWTARDLRAFAAEYGRILPPVEVIRLGHDPGAMAPTTKDDKDDSAARLPPPLGARPFALAVSTVEPRKNYSLLLRCWQQILAADPAFPLDLVIVGRPGHGAADSIREIQASPLLNTRIFWLDACPDAVLADIYAACHLVLYPSFVEGWGLPVAEALAHGREVIASDAGAIPEAAQGAATLLDPRDDGAWIAALREAASRPRRSVPPPQQPGWDSAAARVLAGLSGAVSPAEERSA